MYKRDIRRLILYHRSTEPAAGSIPVHVLISLAGLYLKFITISL